MKIPGPDHPITVSPAPGRVSVVADGEVIATTDRALRLQEAGYPPVFYLPREDAAMDRLTPTDRHTHCPYKGEARYYSIPALGEAGANAVWSYEQPFPAVAEIAGHLAFYPDRVEIRFEG